MIGPDEAVWIDRSDRERLALAGPDRAKLLHNLTTNDIKALRDGRGVEAFVTSPQGKTIGYVTILGGPDRHWVRSDPGGLSLVLPHLQKFAVFEDVELSDERAATFEIHVAGRGVEAPVPAELDHVELGSTTPGPRAIRESPLGLTGMTLFGPLALKEEAVAIANRLDARPLSADEAEGLRIEAGTPRFGLDVTTENLPQEIGRDARAISFVKGCYLGQETVARLDALGHVNKILRGLVGIEGEPPHAGDPLEHDGKPAGVVTSAGVSPRDGRAVALAMVRVRAAEPGTRVSWVGGSGIVQITDTILGAGR